jgi:hypothetical protein
VAVWSSSKASRRNRRKSKDRSVYVVAGSEVAGTESILFAGGWKCDKDNGDCFVYTGNGGTVKGKRCRKDQEYTRNNEALKISMEKGLPVRVVRSFKFARRSAV